MGITHVLRGVEWQVSTPKHILLYRAFNWTPPFYGHLPLLMNADGTKLSKRQGDIRISHYKDSHIFPLALINFIVHSGGGFAKDLERNVRPKCYTIDELAAQFDISRINTHSGKLMSERLLEFNRLELKRKLQDNIEENKLVQEVKIMVQQKYGERISDNYLSLNVSEEHIKNILRWASNRIGTLSDLISKELEFIWLIPKTQTTQQSDVNVIELLKDKLETENDFRTENLNMFLKSFCKENDIKYSSFMKMLRSVLAGLRRDLVLRK
ncbi:hypothetical protein NQ318_011052 [Aromia moschata]|uniref:Glutamyl-tRNA synthetase n=1 Tax=Aromia moschata TaxID=1265417 RepID=A0AAV8YU09_9CUCU|nr:hypothetical protein NQ318_011052 [Aromia moschata]